MHGKSRKIVIAGNLIVDVSKLDCDIFHLGYLLLLGGMDAPDEEYGTKAARLLAKVQAAGIKTSVDIGAAALNLSAVDGTSAAKSFSETMELEKRFPRRKIY